MMSDTPCYLRMAVHAVFCAVGYPFAASCIRAVARGGPSGHVHAFNARAALHACFPSLPSAGLAHLVIELLEGVAFPDDVVLPSVLPADHGPLARFHVVF